MNISFSLIQANTTAGLLSGFGRLMSSSIGKFSAVILATSTTALLGLGIHRWHQAKPEKELSFDQNFENVKAKVLRAYSYIFGGLAITAVSAAIIHASSLSKKILENWMCIPALSIVNLTALITTMICNKEAITTRHIALGIFNVSMGALLSPMGFLKQSVIAQAAFITLSVGSFLTLTAFMAPDKQFIKWEGPLITALIALSTASFVALFFPRTAFAYGVDRVSLYGGLGIFCGLFMVDTHRLVQEAESKDNSVFDPINSSINLYLDIVNIFIRIARIIFENQKRED